MKIGVSFTRFLTKTILPTIKGANTPLLSYGPCQTPTLWFCVNRYYEIKRFEQKEYYKVYVEAEINRLKYKIYYSTNFYEKKSLIDFMTTLKGATSMRVINISTKKNTKASPVGLNTVQMLRVASSFLKMSPHEAMRVAEQLYTRGYITYPRTETTKYASSFPFEDFLNDFSNHPTFGKFVPSIKKSFTKY